MNKELNIDEVVFVRNLIGTEDILFGTGTVQQIRDGEIVMITKIDASSIPYRKTDGTLITIAEALDDLYKRSTNA